MGMDRKGDLNIDNISNRIKGLGKDKRGGKENECF